MAQLVECRFRICVIIDFINVNGVMQKNIGVLSLFRLKEKETDYLRLECQQLQLLDSFFLFSSIFR